MVTTSRRCIGAQRLDGGWGWMIVFATFLSCLVFSGVTRSQGMVMEALMKYYGVTTSEVALVTTVSTFLTTVSSLFGTVLGELYTARVVVITAGLISSFLMSLASLGFGVPYIACTFGLGLGIANGLMYGNCLAMVGSYFRKKRALANSLALSGASIGQMVLPPLIDLIIEEYSVKGSFLLLAGVYLQTVIVGALFRPVGIVLTPDVSLEEIFSEVDEGEEEEHLDEEKGGIPDEDDTTSQFSEVSHVKFADILKHKLQREDSKLTHSIHEDDSGSVTSEASHVRFAESLNQNSFRQRLDSFRSNKFLDGDVISEYSDVNPLKIADILKHKIQREESMISQIGTSGGSTTSKIFLPYASGPTLMSASLANLQHVSHKVEMVMSMVSLQAIDDSPRCSPCCRRPWSIPKIIDLSVLRNVKCVFFCFVFFLIHFMGFNFFLFLPSIAATRGISQSQSSMLLSAVGVADLVGRLACGILANFGLCKRYKIVAACALAMGANMLLFLFFAHAYWVMILQSAINGTAFGGYMTLLSVVLIDCLGLELLPKVLGVVLFAIGLGPSTGQAFLGWLKDMTGNFDSTLAILGVVGLLSGALLLLYPIADKLEEKRIKRLEEREDAKQN